MQLDVLVFAAHPDDAELSASGTIAKLIKQGKKVGIIDLTRGELGSRGSVEERKTEAENSSKVLGISIRENLGFSDGFFENNKEHQLKIISVIRKYQPSIIICNAISDRHIDHGRASKMVSDSIFLSGLIKIETLENDQIQKAWRPKFVLHYIQDRYIKPDLVVDITDTFDIKMKSILAFKSQFYNGDDSLPKTPISSKDFLDFVAARSREFGRSIGVTFGEGFTVERPIGVNNLMDLI